MLKGYNEYKDVELPWLKKIPAGWKLLRNKNVFEEKKELVGNRQKEFNLLSLTKKGIIIRDVSSGKGKFPKDFETYKVVQSGDIIFCFFDVDETPRTVGLSKYNGMITGAYNVFDICNVVPKYVLYYNIAIDNVKGYKPLYSGLRKVIPLQAFFATKMPVPSKPEQDKIVQFLDRKTSEMNCFIHQKKKQIKVLEELKRNIIDDLMTNGKNSEKQVKTSKAKWMGNVPYDWNEYRLKNLFQEINVRSELGMEPHLSMSQKKGLVTDDEDIERRLLSESYAGAKLCEKDDLVLNRLKAHLGVFALAPMKGIVSPDYTVLRINSKRVIPKYLEYLLKSNACRRELVTRVRGIVEGFWRLYTEDLGEIPVCIPDIDEQKAILEVILEKANHIDEMISAINKEITLVEELRTKLISDVVTGQVDVRDVKIPAYETKTDIINSEDDTDEENLNESMEE